MRVRAIRTIPGRATPGEVLEVTESEGRLLIQAGKVVPHGDDGPTLADKSIKDTEVTKRGRRKRD